MVKFIWDNDILWDMGTKSEPFNDLDLWLRLNQNKMQRGGGINAIFSNFRISEWHGGVVM